MSEQTVLEGQVMNRETLETYRELVSIAEEGPSEYVAVVSEMQDHHVASEKMSHEEVTAAEEWARETALHVCERMEEEDVAPHYYISALIESLYAVGFNQLALSLESASQDAFARDYA